MGIWLRLKHGQGSLRDGESREDEVKKLSVHRPVYFEKLTSGDVERRREVKIVDLPPPPPAPKVEVKIIDPVVADEDETDEAKPKASKKPKG